MNTVIVLSAEKVAREALAATVSRAPMDVVQASPTNTKRALAAIERGEVGVIVLDARDEAEQCFMATAAMEGSIDVTIPIVLICRTVNRDHLRALRTFGVEKIFESDGFEIESFMEVVSSIMVSFEACASDVDHSGSVSTSNEESAPSAPEASPRVVIHWDGLYDDRGLLGRETSPVSTGTNTSGPGSGVDAAARRPASDRERVLSAQETRSLVEHYLSAKPLKENVKIALSRVNDPKASVDDLGLVIRRDQALSARVLQIANSNAYRRGKAVNSVEQAMVRIGLEGVRQAVTVASCMEQLGDSDRTIVDAVHLWEHSFAVACIASDLAKATRVCPADDAFMIGLLHDLGRVVMFEMIGEPYVEALRSARERGEPVHRVEKSRFELNHADVAESVFRSWSFGDEIIIPIANHHLSLTNLRHLDPLHESTVLLLQLANELAHASLVGDSGDDWIDDAIMVIGDRAVPPGAVKNTLKRTQRVAADMRTAIRVAAGGESRSTLHDMLRERLDADARPVVLSDESGLRCETLVVESLVGVQSPREANIAVARVGSSEEVAGLAAQLAEFDERSPDDPVPLIAVVPEMDEEIDGLRELLASRPSSVLGVPFRRTTLIQQMNTLRGDGVGQAMAA
ncbi:MAG: HDOD domain-containing protein [Planctomycetota bacterium]